ncbi:endonuclease/exonuclease/phosphatase family protein [Actinomycetospora termitidis]|uniref:Endonuclease/exonuclease/phosphatase family protein n=1 Tax=Actinomycetospora termitidis TaxID=3053470 RepID=A0ABT7MD06_9PSEU|nr:endonuclease/exonuclease/phosphatase family protein [Actinomycetospora sp. Odt1-22]MDL5158558.1 endonuclease/exonuclease/phosphatase family protein [Actinomycetospora sp. Odt1-22]
MRRPLPAVLGVVLGAAVALAVLLPGYVGLDGVTPFVQLAALTPMLLVVITGSVFVGRLAGVLVMRGRRGKPPLDERRPQLFAFGFAAMVAAAVVALSAAGIVGSRLLADEPAPPGPGTSVLVLNVDQGRADVPALTALVRDRRPDVVVLLEAGEPYRAALAPGLPGYRSWSARTDSPRDAASTTVLLGPAAPEPRVVTVPSTLYGTLDLSWPGLRVVAVHTAAPYPPSRVGLWQQDLAALVAPPCRGDAPVVVAGDLNATTDHSAFRAATEGCVDALESVGAGTTGTYPTDLPRWFGVQIDHVLAGGGVGVQGGEVLDVPGTDHRAVLARLSLPR